LFALSCLKSDERKVKRLALDWVLKMHQLCIIKAFRRSEKQNKMLKEVAKVETLLMNSTLDYLSDAKTAYNKALLTNISENKCVKPKSVETEIVGKKSVFSFLFFFLFFFFSFFT
jgi:predicted CoA-binding protein